MENFSEVIKIIEAGLEGDRTKLIAYANILTNKVTERQSTMIIDVITGEYKKKDVLKLMSNKPEVNKSYNNQQNKPCEVSGNSSQP